MNQGVYALRGRTAPMDEGRGKGTQRAMIYA